MSSPTQQQSPQVSGTGAGKVGEVRARAPKRPLYRRVFGASEFGIIATFLFLIAVISVFNPSFFRLNALTNIGEQAAFYGIIALGMVFLLSMREIDLSVGSLYGLSVVVAAVSIRAGLDPWLAAIVCILVGIAGGALNGILSNLLRIPSIIITLGTLSVFKGLTLVISGSQTVSGMPREHPFFTILGADFLEIPMIIWAFALLTAIMAIVYKRTRFGFIVRAIGSNPDAARLTGISLEKTRLFALMLIGGLAGVCGVFTLAFFESADPGLGGGFEILVIAAAIIGGTTLAGGVGSVVGAAFGALTIGAIRSGLVQFGITSEWTQFATGVVIIGAVALDTFIRIRNKRS
ncbi:MAG: ABC transporter permease [Microcella sp.]|uniref:ABC transporter permease n=1 Tax=Microcella sp. TaxID=1913979 RepID=UPI0033164868